MPPVSKGIQKAKSNNELQFLATKDERIAYAGWGKKIRRKKKKKEDEEKGVGDKSKRSVGIDGVAEPQESHIRRAPSAVVINYSAACGMNAQDQTGGAHILYSHASPYRCGEGGRVDWAVGRL